MTFSPVLHEPARLMADAMNRGRLERAVRYIMAGSCSFQNVHYMLRMIVIAFFQQLAVLSSAFMQLHGLLFLFLLYRKRNIDLLVTDFARKKNLFVKRCKELKIPPVLWLA